MTPRPRPSISHTGAGEWFEGLHATLDELESHIRGRPKVALTLIEHVLHRLERASAAVDDSDGGMVETVGRLRHLFIACSDAAGIPPDGTDERLRELATPAFWPADS